MMEAKDTVMSEVELCEFLFTYTVDDLAPKADLDGKLRMPLKTILEHQAEITWPIARQVGFEIGLEQGKAEGIREVVEWIERVPPVKNLPEGTMKHYAVSIEQWEAKLKEWGIR